MLENVLQGIPCDFKASQGLWTTPSQVCSIASCGWAYTHIPTHAVYHFPPTSLIQILPFVRLPVKMNHVTWSSNQSPPRKAPNAEDLTDWLIFISSTGQPSVRNDNGVSRPSWIVGSLNISLTCSRLLVFALTQKSHVICRTFLMI